MSIKYSKIKIKTLNGAKLASRRTKKGIFHKSLNFKERWAPVF
jgi:hypothetical protein